jgi:hypothetical protein
MMPTRLPERPAILAIEAFVSRWGRYLTGPRSGVIAQRLARRTTSPARRPTTSSRRHGAPQDSTTSQGHDPAL